MSYIPVQIVNSTGELYHPPVSPSAFDDEFDGATLDARWDIDPAGTLVGGAVSAISTNTGANQRQEYATRRTSWMTIQNGSGGGVAARGISQLIGAPIPTGVYWWRWAPLFRGGTAGVNRDGTFAAQLTADAAGVVDTNNQVLINNNRDPAATFDTETVKVEGGAASSVLSTLGWQTREMIYPYGAFRVVATNQVECWGGSHNGAWNLLRNFSYTGAALARIGFRQIVRATSPVGNLMAMLDFFRFKADGNLP